MSLFYIAQAGPAAMRPIVSFEEAVPCREDARNADRLDHARSEVEEGINLTVDWVATLKLDRKESSTSSSSSMVVHRYSTMNGSFFPFPAVHVPSRSVPSFKQSDVVLLNSRNGTDKLRLPLRPAASHRLSNLSVNRMVCLSNCFGMCLCMCVLTISSMKPVASYRQLRLRYVGCCCCCQCTGFVISSVVWTASALIRRQMSPC